MKAAELAGAVRVRYGTSDVYAIAEACGLTISAGRWHPVTAGEFDRRSGQITVNLNAPFDTEKIAAHELGHYFIDEFGVETPSEEDYCDEFAAVLTGRNVR
jgi:hypothetical protein